MANGTLDLRELKIPLGKLAPLEKFRTRQGDELSYRFYPAWSEDLIVLYHGVGSDSRYMCILASALASSGIASVVTPDFRCHGTSFGSTDIISASQLEIDLEELLIYLKMQKSISRVTLAGHSLGGGFVLRISVSDLRHQFAKFVALAPYLPASLEAWQENHGGWITLDADGLGGFQVNVPQIFLSGNEKLHYSPEFLEAVHPPEDLVAQLKALQPPVQIIIGAGDEVEKADRYPVIFAETGVPVTVIPDLNHLTIVSRVSSYLSKF